MGQKGKVNLKIYLLFTVLGFALYGNTLKNDYALDDAIVIYQNTFTKQGIKGIDDIFKYDSFVGFWLNSNPNQTPEQIQKKKNLVVGGRYRPLSIATFALETEFFGQSPVISHFVNIILYILTAFLLYHFLLYVFPQDDKKWWFSIPVISVILFMAHPIHTEVVANIKGRDELLSLIGAMVAGLMYFKYLKKQRFIYLIFIFASLLLGLLSKENAITWFAIIAVAAYFFVDRRIKLHILPILMLLFASIVFLSIRYNVLDLSELDEHKIPVELMNNPFVDASKGERFGTILLTFWYYIKLLFYPKSLTYDYYPYHIELTSILNILPIAMMVLYSLMLIFAFVVFFVNFIKETSKKLRIAAFCIVLFLAPLSVVCNLFFPVGVFMAERFLYFSSIAFVLSYALLLVYLYKRNKYLSYALIFITVFLYGFKTIDRNTEWKDDFTLFTTDVKISGNSAKANTTAGGKLLERASDLLKHKDKGNNSELAKTYIKQAKEYLHKAIEIHPKYVDPMLLLGNAYYQDDKNIAQAIHWYSEIIKFRPSHDLAIKNSIISLDQVAYLFSNNKNVNSVDEVIIACDKLEKVIPNMSEIYRVKGLMYARFKGDFKTAIPYYEKALELNPKDADAWKDFGVIYGQSGNFPKALECFLNAFKLTPDDPQVASNVAITYLNLGDDLNAQKWFNKRDSLNVKPN